MPDVLTSLALIPVGRRGARRGSRGGSRLPSILAAPRPGLLLGAGLGWLDPDQLFGDLLTRPSTLAVALILFEGGLSLSRAGAARAAGCVVPRLLTVGVGITFACGPMLALNVLDLPGDRLQRSWRAAGRDRPDGRRADPGHGPPPGPSGRSSRPRAS